MRIGFFRHLNEILVKGFATWFLPLDDCINWRRVLVLNDVWYYCFVCWIFLLHLVHLWKLPWSWNGVGYAVDSSLHLGHRISHWWSLNSKLFTRNRILLLMSHHRRVVFLRNLTVSLHLQLRLMFNNTKTSNTDAAVSIIPSLFLAKQHGHRQPWFDFSQLMRPFGSFLWDHRWEDAFTIFGSIIRYQRAIAAAGIGSRLHQLRNAFVFVLEFLIFLLRKLIQWAWSTRRRKMLLLIRRTDAFLEWILHLF